MKKPFINSLNNRSGKTPFWKCNRNNPVSKVQLIVLKEGLQTPYQNNSRESKNSYKGGSKESGLGPIKHKDKNKDSPESTSPEVRKIITLTGRVSAAITCTVTPLSTT